MKFSARRSAIKPLYNFLEHQQKRSTVESIITKGVPAAIVLHRVTVKRVTYKIQSNENSACCA